MGRGATLLMGGLWEGGSETDIVLDIIFVLHGLPITVLHFAHMWGRPRLPCVDGDARGLRRSSAPTAMCPRTSSPGAGTTQLTANSVTERGTAPGPQVTPLTTLGGVRGQSEHEGLYR